MKKIALIFTAVLGLGASSATAAPTLCAPGPHAGGLALTDVKLEGVNATNCYGVVSGNTSNTDINGILPLEFGDSEDWGPEIKDAAPGQPTNGTGSFYGVNWTLSSSAGKAGTYSLSFVDTEPSKLNFTADLLILLKGSNRYAAYYFNDFLFDSTTNAGAWDINFVNNGGQTPDLSHMSVYFRDGTAICTVRCEGDPQSVPEPVALSLLGTALFGFAAARRRRQ